MFVKICGITSLAAAEAVVDAGADAVGFVFAPSPRQVSIDAALEMSRALPAGVLRVAVMRHPAREHVERIVGELAPDWLQTDAQDFAGLELPPGCLPLPVYRSGSVPPGLGSGLAASAGADTDPLPRLLFEGPVSGSGRTADWAEARTLAARARLVLAGGLNAGNIADAVAEVRPWGVDVSSGVESSPGIKDPGRIREFVARARAAAATWSAMEEIR